MVHFTKFLGNFLCRYRNLNISNNKDNEVNFEVSYEERCPVQFPLEVFVQCFVRYHHL